MGALAIIDRWRYGAASNKGGAEASIRVNDRGRLGPKALTDFCFEYEDVELFGGGLRGVVADGVRVAGRAESPRGSGDANDRR